MQAVAAVHAEHRRTATLLERGIVRVTGAISAPAFLVVTTCALVLWVVLNLALPRAFDPPPFVWLQALVAVGALNVTLVILAAQARQDLLVEQGAQLTLHLAMISEQKLAKVISLLEELRRDLPHVADRIDPDAVAMGKPADPHAVLSAIRESHEATEQ